MPDGSVQAVPAMRTGIVIGYNVDGDNVELVYRKARLL